MVSSRELDKLKKLLPPPENPVDNRGDWEQVEELLGTTLPKDYKQFTEIYGAGEINKFFRIYTPFTKNPSFHFGIWKPYAEAFRPIRDNFPKDFPYPLFPEKGGALTFGFTISGDNTFWITQGIPDRWFIASRQHGFPMVSYKKHNLIKFLIDLLQEKLDPMPFTFDYGPPFVFHVAPDKDD